MNLDRIEKLARLFGSSGAHELQVEADGWRIALRRGTAAPAASVTSGSLPEAEAPPEESIPTLSIDAPMVGIYRQGELGLEPGDRVEAGMAVGSIESMKILNPLIAEIDAEVVEVLVEDGYPVQYGQPLFLLTPLNGSEEEAAP